MVPGGRLWVVDGVCGGRGKAPNKPPIQWHPEEKTWDIIYWPRIWSHRTSR